MYGINDFGGIVVLKKLVLFDGNGLFDGGDSLCWIFIFCDV